MKILYVSRYSVPETADRVTAALAQRKFGVLATEVESVLTESIEEAIA